jgi:predicted ATPase
MRARTLDQAASLTFALSLTVFTYFLCGRYAVAISQVDELANLASEKGLEQWKPYVLIQRGYVSGASDKASDAVTDLAAGIDLWRSTGATIDIPLFQALLAGAHARLGQLDAASQMVSDAINIIEITKEKWCQAEVYRLAGVIALTPATPDATKAEDHFERALAVARQQQAKSWELRAAMSLARLWRSQGKPQQARELLAPVYGWFTEGFDTLDLKEAKALLEELAA